MKCSLCGTDTNRHMKITRDDTRRPLKTTLCGPCEEVMREEYKAHGIKAQFEQVMKK